MGVSGLEHEGIHSFFCVSAHRGFCLFHPIFYKSMVNDYIFSSPSAVGMTTHPALSHSSRQVIFQGPGERGGIESEGRPLAPFSSHLRGQGRMGRRQSLGKALWFWLSHKKSSLSWHTHYYCLDVALLPQPLPWTELISLAAVEHDPG